MALRLLLIRQINKDQAHNLLAGGHQKPPLDQSIKYNAARVMKEGPERVEGVTDNHTAPGQQISDISTLL